MKNYGRSSKLLLAEKDISDLHFDVKDTGILPEKTEVVEITDMDTKCSVIALQNSNCQENLRNSLESVAGEAQKQVRDQRSLKQALDSKLHSNASEYREHSQKSRDSGKPTDGEAPGKLVKRTFIREMHLQHSDFSKHSQNLRIKQAAGVEEIVSAEDAKSRAASSDFSKHSQNSLSKGKPNADPGEAKMTFGDPDGQCLLTVSEFREPSPNSQVVTNSDDDKQQQNSVPVCIDEPSEYSQDPLHVGNNVSVPSFSWFKSMSQIVGLTATWHSKVEGNPTTVGTASNAKVNISPVHTEFNFFL